MLYNKPVSDKVYVYDIEAGRICKTIVAGRGPHGVVINENGTMAIILPIAEGDMFIQNALGYGLYVSRSLAFHTIPGKA